MQAVCGGYRTANIIKNVPESKFFGVFFLTIFRREDVFEKRADVCGKRGGGKSFPGSGNRGKCKVARLRVALFRGKIGVWLRPEKRNLQPATFVGNPYACVGAYAYLYIYKIKLKKRIYL